MIKRRKVLMRLIILFLSGALLFSCSRFKNVKTPRYDSVLTGFDYPFDVHFFEFKTQKKILEMAYMDLNKSSENVVLLLHGKNFSGFYWKKIANDLVKMNYRVVIPDQVGFGKSSKPGHYQYSFGNLALNTKKLLGHLNIKKFIVVGHSMGGMLATQMSYLYPEMVKKMILINPIGLEPYLDFVKYKDPDFFYELELSKTPEKFKAYQQKNYYDGKWKKEYEDLIIPFAGQMRGKDWPLVAWNNALTYGPIFTEDMTSKFSKITNEVVLIIGTRDKTGPGRHWKRRGVSYQLGQYSRLGEATKNKFKKAKLYELKGLGHLPQFEDYSRFSKVFYRNF